MKQRQSSIELLRLVLMWLIVMLHFNYLGIGLPTQAEAAAAPAETFSRVWAEQVCACAVNAFILLSGWFGIRLHWGRMGRNILLRCVVYGVLIVGALAWAGTAPFSWKNLIKALLPGAEYWFVVCYIGLWLLSPVLNAFVRSASKRALTGAVAALSVFEWLYGWLFDAAFLNDGYSIFSFAVLYLLGRCMRLYPAAIIKKGAPVHAAVFILTSSVAALAVWGVLVWAPEGVCFRVLYAAKSYLCPLVIIESAALVVCFARMDFQSRLLNYLGSSALAIYLIHAHTLVAPRLLDWAGAFYAAHSGFIAWGGLAVFGLGVCAVCLTADIVLFRLTRVSVR